jgi:Ni,Fe-hydrogenase III large subunit
MSTKYCSIHNNESTPIDSIPVLNPADFNETLSSFLADEYLLSAFFADPEAKELYAVCSNNQNGSIKIIRSKIVDNKFESFTNNFTQAHLFEREIFETTKIEPLNHPWLKSVRFPQSSKSKIGDIPFFKIAGDEIHEVGVGPVHAGVIEPGHFRFQCHGETVYHLEISLGYQHRGFEKMLVDGPNSSTRHLMEIASGDATIGHVTAYSEIIESLTKTQVSMYDNILRSVLLELERCANHVGDVGALAGDAGFMPTQQFCGRIRGDFLNMTAVICGNRFGRDAVVPGGVNYQIDEQLADELSQKVSMGLKEFLDAAKIMFDNPTVVSRFESIGTVSKDDALAIGMVGPAARASGIIRDIRHDYPSGNYCFTNIPLASKISGTVFARTYVKWLEIQSSVKFVLEQLTKLKKMNHSKKESKIITKPLAKNSISVSLCEGWRGEICHVAITNANSKFKMYKIYDPSFHNWLGLSLSLRNQQISDFPLCNKSFNLSYCGHDL